MAVLRLPVSDLPSASDLESDLESDMESLSGVAAAASDSNCSIVSTSPSVSATLHITHPAPRIFKTGEMWSL